RLSCLEAINAPISKFSVAACENGGARQQATLDGLYNGDLSCCPQMNFDQPPPYGGPGTSAPGYPAPTAPGYSAPMAPGYQPQGYQPQGFPDQGYPAQGYPAPGYPPTDPSYSNFPPGPPGLYQGQPGYQGYQMPPQPQFGWQDTPPGAQTHGEAPKNTGLEIKSLESRIATIESALNHILARLPPPTMSALMRLELSHSSSIIQSQPAGLAVTEHDSTASAASLSNLAAILAFYQKELQERLSDDAETMKELSTVTDLLIQCLQGNAQMESRWRRGARLSHGLLDGPVLLLFVGHDDLITEPDETRRPHHVLPREIYHGRLLLPHPGPRQGPLVGLLQQATPLLLQHVSRQAVTYTQGQRYRVDLHGDAPTRAPADGHVDAILQGFPPTAQPQRQQVTVSQAQLHKEVAVLPVYGVVGSLQIDGVVQDLGHLTAVLTGQAGHSRHHMALLNGQHHAPAHDGDLRAEPVPRLVPFGPALLVEQPPLQGHEGLVVALCCMLYPCDQLETEQREFMVWSSPSACQHIVVPLAKVHQLGEWVVEPPVEAHHHVEVRVGVVVHLPVGSVLELLDHLSVAAEDGERRARVVRGDVVLLPAGHLHGKQMALQVVVEREWLYTWVDPAGVVEICVEELQVLSLVGLPGDAAAQAVVAVADAPPPRCAAVRLLQQPVGVVDEDVGATLAQDTVLIHAVLHVAQAGDAVAQVVAQRQQAGAVPRVQQVQVAVQVVAVAPGGPVVDFDPDKLSVPVVLIAVLCCVSIRPDLQLSLDDPAHAVILYRHPVHERAEDLVLHLFDAAVGVKVLAEGHHCRDVIVAVEVHGQGRLADHRLDAGHTEAVIVGAYFTVSDGAGESPTLQVNHLQHSGCLVVAERHSCAVVQNLRQLGQLAILIDDASTRAQVKSGTGSSVFAEVVDDGGVTLGRVVDVADVADGHAHQVSGGGVGHVDHSQAAAGKPGGWTALLVVHDPQRELAVVVINLLCASVAVKINGEEVPAMGLCRVLVSLGGQQACVCSIAHHRHLLVEGRYGAQAAGRVQPQGDHLVLRQQHQPQLARSVPPHPQGVVTVISHSSQLPVRPVGEVIEGFSSDQTDCLSVDPISTEHIELLLPWRPHLIQPHWRGHGPVAPHCPHTDVVEIGDEQRAIGRHSERGGGVEPGVRGVALVAGEALAVDVVLAVALGGGASQQRGLSGGADLPHAVDLLLVRLGDVEHTSVGDGDGRGALQGRVDGQLAQGVVYARNLAVHGPPSDDVDLVVLCDAEDHVVLQHVQGVVCGVHCQVCGPLQTHLDQQLHEFSPHLTDVHAGVTAEWTDRCEVIGLDQGGDNAILVHLTDHGGVNKVHEAVLIHSDP
ncbi:unnamed protein product, partial [Coregonus sp. 'balchen']